MTVTEAITQAAHEYGVDPNLALATATVESGLNPTAVGDGGTSFGLFQLHRGGELGSMSPQQAFDPLTNARRALSEFANVLKVHPGISGGTLAALAQRPADPVGYAKKVDAALMSLGGSAGGAVGAVAAAPANGISWLTGILGLGNPAELFTRGGFVIAGFLLVAVGAYIAFSSSGGGTQGERWTPSSTTHSLTRTAIH
jgi:hypothetical protein